MPKRERYVWVCTNRRPEGAPKGSCASCGSEELQKLLKASIAQAGLAGRVRVMAGGCQDLCWVGPTLGVMPDDVFFGRLTEADLPALVQVLSSPLNAGENPLLAHKLVQPSEYDDPALVQLRAPKTP